MCFLCTLPMQFGTAFPGRLTQSSEDQPLITLTIPLASLNHGPQLELWAMGNIGNTHTPALDERTESRIMRMRKGVGGGKKHPAQTGAEAKLRHPGLRGSCHSPNKQANTEGPGPIRASCSNVF